MGCISLIVGAGPLYADVDADDHHHASCLELLTSAEVRFVGDLASGALNVEPVAPRDWLRIAELVARYHDLQLGTVDASVVATAERLGERTVATLDRRHFTVVRPAHAPAFELVP